MENKNLRSKGGGGGIASNMKMTSLKNVDGISGKLSRQLTRKTVEFETIEVVLGLTLG